MSKRQRSKGQNSKGQGSKVKRDQKRGDTTTASSITYYYQLKFRFIIENHGQESFGPVIAGLWVGNEQNVAGDKLKFAPQPSQGVRVNVVRKTNA